MSEIDHLVVLRAHEARLVVHVLSVFERLLRQGELQPHQLRQLVPDGSVAGRDQPDVEMAEVVVEAGEPLRRQLP